MGVSAVPSPCISTDCAADQGRAARPRLVCRPGPTASTTRGASPEGGPVVPPLWAHERGDKPDRAHGRGRGRRGRQSGAWGTDPTIVHRPTARESAPIGRQTAETGLARLRPAWRGALFARPRTAGLTCAQFCPQQSPDNWTVYHLISIIFSRIPGARPLSWRHRGFCKANPYVVWFLYVIP